MLCLSLRAIGRVPWLNPPALARQVRKAPLLLPGSNVELGLPSLWGGGLLLLPFLLANCAAPGPRRQQSPPEKTVRLSGVVLDSLTQKPVPNVLVQSSTAGTVGMAGAYARTDEKGRFDLSLSLVRREDAGALFVKTILYDGKATLPADTTQRVTLLLKRNAYRFQPYGCQQPADSVHIPPYYAGLPEMGLPNFQFAFLIKDTALHQPHRLRSLTFRIGRNGFEREPFQIRIYQHTEPSQPPGPDVFTEFFIACPDAEGVFTYDLSGFNTVVPVDGFFVALEYKTGGDKFYCTDPAVGYIPTGTILRPPCASADTRTWQYSQYHGGWKRLTPAAHYWPLYESALSVEVEPTPLEQKSR